jgi:four helix bundle protein
MRTFEELIVWQKARVLCREVHQMARGAGRRMNYRLGDQMCRAAESVMSNIAEGFGRFGHAEFRRYLVIARGSLFELRSQLYIALDLGYLTAAEHSAFRDRCAEVERLLAALRNSLGRSPSNGS